MKRIHVKVRSTCPLLMHKFSTQASAQLAATVKKSKSGPPDPKEEAESGAYRLDPTDGEKQGQLCLPGEHFFQAMVMAAGGFQVQGKGKKTYRDAIKGNVYVEPDFMGLNTVAGNKLYNYTIDSRPARIKQARIIRNRPRLDEWVTEFDLITTDEDTVSPAVLNSILVNAGQTKGVGDYRPRFGRFLVEEFKEVA